jgi:hypothetical protein
MGSITAPMGVVLLEEAAMPLNLEVFDFIIKTVEHSKKHVFSKEEILALLCKLKDEWRRDSGKVMQQEIWDEIRNRRGGVL